MFTLAIEFIYAFIKQIDRIAGIKKASPPREDAFLLSVVK